MILQKTSLLGLSLHEAKRGVSESFLVVVGENKTNGSSSSIARRRLEITARTAGASKTIEVDVDKPLGLTLGQKPGGGVVITVSIYLSHSPPPSPHNNTFHFDDKQFNAVVLSSLKGDDFNFLNEGGDLWDYSLSSSLGC